jgi:hypothetical protein
MRRLVIIIGLVSVGVLVSAILLGQRHLAPPQRLPDGSTLWPKQIRLGPAQFYHGSTFEKLLGRVLPAQGISFGQVVLPPLPSIIFPATNRLIVQFQFFPINNSSKLLTLARSF